MNFDSLDLTPFLNETGVRETMALLSGIVTTTHSDSALDEDRILKLCKHVNLTLLEFYYTNWERFNLDSSKAGLLVNIIMDIYETNLRKSLHAYETKTKFSLGPVSFEINRTLKKLK